MDSFDMPKLVCQNAVLLCRSCLKLELERQGWIGCSLAEAIIMVLTSPILWHSIYMSEGQGGETDLFWPKFTQ